MRNNTNLSGKHKLFEMILLHTDRFKGPSNNGTPKLQFSNVHCLYDFASSVLSSIVLFSELDSQASLLLSHSSSKDFSSVANKLAEYLFLTPLVG